MTKLSGGGISLLLAAVVLFVCTIDRPASAQTATKLNCKGCVAAKQLGNNAVTKKKIKKNAVSASRLAADAKPGGIEFAANQTVAPLSTTEMAYVLLEVDVPSPGYILANVNGNINFAAATSVDCRFADGTPNQIRVGGAFNADTDGRTTFSHTHVITVLNAGPFNVDWRCVLSTTSDGTQLNGYEASALFVPNRY